MFSIMKSWELSKTKPGVAAGLDEDLVCGTSWHPAAPEGRPTQDNVYFLNPALNLLIASINFFSSSVSRAFF